MRYGENNPAKNGNEMRSKVKKNGSYLVENIPVHDEDGVGALAWSLPELLRKWAGRIREVSMDSACK